MAAIESAVADAVVRVCHDLREQGHAAGMPREREVVRMALDLAQLRSLPAPGRHEMVEALQACLAQGEPLGRGRAVARAMQRVLAGSGGAGWRPARPARAWARTSRRCSPSCGCLGRPTRGRSSCAWTRCAPGSTGRRVVAIHRLTACGVPYAVSRWARAATGSD